MSNVRRRLSRITSILIPVFALLLLTACGNSPSSDSSATLNGFTDVPSAATNTPRPATNTPRPATNTPRPATTTSRPATATTRPNGVQTIQLPQGFAAQKGFWQVYFTAPTGSRDASTYTGGIDQMLVASLSQARQTIDIAAYEFNLPSVTQAVLDAAGRGVRVRVVTDATDGIGDSETTLHELVDAGITVVPDTRSALMHDKFIIIDSTLVWMGTWNYTINDTYRNNNTALVLRSQNAVADYQAEFNEMFVNQQFGPRSPENTPNVTFTQDGTPMEVYFAPETEVIPVLVREINAARTSIRFLAFSFTVDEMGDAIASRAAAGVNVQGVFETTGSETSSSELRPLFCAGLSVRQDGNSFVMHEKVFIIDSSTVVVGSFNFSDNAANSNDENLIIIRDSDLAAQYNAEFDRRWADAHAPSGLSCS